jgi:hypothetical protein
VDGFAVEALVSLLAVEDAAAPCDPLLDASSRPPEPRTRNTRMASRATTTATTPKTSTRRRLTRRLTLPVASSYSRTDHSAWSTD